MKDRTSLGLVFATEPVKHEMAEYDVREHVISDSIE